MAKFYTYIEDEEKMIQKHKEIGRWKGENNPMYGKKQSARNKEALKKANTGRKLSPESRKKISDSMKGRVPWNKK